MEILYCLAAFLFYGYFLTYILMGFIQPIGAICRLISEKRLDSTYAIGLKKYLLSVSAYFVMLFFILQFEMSFDTVYIVPFYLGILPWTFAIWYIRHIRKWNQKKKNIKAYDDLQLLNAPHEDRLLLESYPTKKVEISSSLNGVFSEYASSSSRISVKNLSVSQ